MGSDRPLFLSLSLGRRLLQNQRHSSKTAMKLRILQVLVVLAGVAGGAKGATNCQEALEESSACQERAMAAHDADYIEPTAELGKEWLNIEARRNCRLITKINTCIDELVAFCPDMLKPITKSYMEVVDHLEELTDCVAEVDKFSACADAGKERRKTWLDAGGDGREHFAERKLCNWITEDYEQCYKPFVATKCGFEQSKADDLVAKTVDVIQSHFPDWDSEKCPTASHVLSQRQKNEEGKVAAENESEEDDIVENKSGHTDQTSLFGFVLMTLIITWIA